MVCKKDGGGGIRIPGLFGARGTLLARQYKSMHSQLEDWLLAGV